MKSFLKVLVLVFAVCALGVSAPAALFFNQSVSQDWSNIANWDDTADWTPAGRVPGLTDDIPLRNAPIIYSGTAAEAQNIWVGPWAGVSGGSLAIESGGSLHTAGYLFVGSADTSDGTDGMLFINGGQLNVDDHLIIGADPGTSGFMQVNDGVVNTLGGGLFVGGNGWGHLDITGGTINTSYIGFAAWGGGAGVITFNGNGQIISLADQVAEVQDWIDWGWVQNAPVDSLAKPKASISNVPHST